MVAFMDRMSEQLIFEDNRRTVKGKKRRGATWRFRHKILQDYFSRDGSEVIPFFVILLQSVRPAREALRGVRSTDHARLSSCREPSALRGKPRRVLARRADGSRQDDNVERSVACSAERRAPP